MDVYIGKWLKLTTKDKESYEGVCSQIDIANKKVVLKKVRNCQTDEKRKVLTFYSDQLQDLAVLNHMGDDLTVAANRGKDSDNESKDAAKKKEEIVLDKSESTPSITQYKPTPPKNYLSGFDTVHPSPIVKSPDGRLIDKADKHFYDAMCSLNSQKVISVAAEGRNVSRFGFISLLCIGSTEMVYLFDMERLVGCENEFKHLLENTNVSKVMHDVRLTSDCLFHYYGISPANVFDSQVADCFIQRMYNGQFPHKLISLEESVKRYLGNDESFESEKHSIVQKRKGVWERRPLPQELLNCCSLGAMYLRELKHILTDKMLSEYIHGVDIYLGDVRSLNDHQAKIVSMKRLPRQFGQFEEMKQHRTRGKTPPAKQASKMRSRWDDGTDFSERYAAKHGSIVECNDNSVPMIDRSKPLLREKSREEEKRERMQKTKNSTDSYNSNSTNNFNSHTRKDNTMKNFDNSTDDEELSHKFDSLAVDDHQLSTAKNEVYSAWNPANNDTNKYSDSEIFPSVTPAAKQNPPTRNYEEYVMSTASESSDGDFQFISVDDKQTFEDYPPLLNVKNNNATISLRGNRNGPLHVKQTNKNVPSHTKTNESIATSDEERSAVKRPSMGRGRCLEALSKQFQQQKKQLGDKNGFDFPGDEEILNTPHISPLTVGIPEAERVSVRQKLR